MKIDLIGRVFGRLTVIGLLHQELNKKHKHWQCRCECGKEVIIRASHLLVGSSKSCGCLAVEVCKNNGIKSGQRMKDGLAAVLASGIKECSDCREPLPFDRFHKNRSHKRGFQNVCKTCTAKRTREWALKRNFNITEEEYQKIFQHQQGVCALCKRPPKKSKLAVDHRHGDGLLRSLLCWKCNNAIGSFRENIPLMEAVIRYLSLAPEGFPVSQTFGIARYGIKGRVTNKAATVKNLNRKSRSLSDKPNPGEVHEEDTCGNRAVNSVDLHASN